MDCVRHLLADFVTLSWNEEIIFLKMNLTHQLELFLIGQDL